MPDPRRRKCKDCGRSDTDVGELSWNGLCHECGQGRVVLNNVQLQAKRGPMHDHWQRRLARGVGIALLDDTTAKP